MTTIQSILETTFGHREFRLEQKRIIEAFLAGEDCLGIMPTGGGKSLCYQIPAILKSGLTVVISPLISLMYDQVVDLQENGVKAAFLNSSIDFQTQMQIKEEILAGKVKLLYLSPEGALGPAWLEFLKQLPIELIAIDEAHCVSLWGHEFRKDYTRLGELRDYFPSVPLMALTATADQRTRQDILRQLRMPKAKVFLSTFDRPNIRYLIQEREDELVQLEKFIRGHHQGETGIVYCLSRKKTEKVTEALKNRGFKAYTYHAGLSSEVKQKVQDHFNRDDGVIIVATIAFGMGINRPDVRFVAHLDLPKSIEGYYQETGRAGRDGEPSNAWMVYGLQDVIKLSQMLETTDADPTYKKVARFKLDSMLSLCEATQCRRKILLGYFEEMLAQDCGNCDWCLEGANVMNVTVEAQMLLSTIYKTGQIFGSGLVIDVLRGSQSAKITQRGFDQLSVFAIGKAKSNAFWSAMIRQLLTQGYIQIKNWDYLSLALAEKSRILLKGEGQFFMAQRSMKEAPTSAPKKREKLKSENPEMFERLRALRKRMADEKGIPPFLIFSDKSLHDMCLLKPRNPKEFLLVNGVGAKKLQEYGTRFLQEMKDLI